MSEGRATGAAVIALAAGLLGDAPASADTSLVPVSASWKFRDDGSNQGTAWRAAGFDDSGWAAGPAQLGYGDGDEATVVSYGPNPAGKYITTYLRHTFAVPSPSSFSSVTLRLMRDDGAVVYLNGAEVLRSNMPSGTIGYTTPASSAVAGAAESTFQTASLSAALLATGTNVLAVEVHQESGGSSDVSFALELIGVTSPASVALTRGPYLQSATPGSMTVRWRTDTPSDSRVSYGLAPGALGSSVEETTPRTEHEVTITGLQPATRYYYSVGSSADTLASGADQFFWTPPIASTPAPTRIWVLGDSGTADASAGSVRNAYSAYTGPRYTDLWLMLGDNAYEEGTDAEYQAAVFDMYPTFLKQSVLWPTIGNHDSADSPAPTSDLPYHRIFTLPQAGEAGGVPSGTEDYYSFDHANIHFVCLDSMTTSRAAGSPMLTWLAQDLASTTQDWTIAFWHHPPYSRGAQDSDFFTELTEMRENVLPILESHGVDLVLAGHSHTYERSFLLDGHYGTSDTFSPEMKKDGGSGRVGEGGAYQKATAGPAPHEGTVYVVAATSGSTLGGSLNHPAMFVSFSQLGSLVIDVNGNQLEATFLLSSGAVGDRFTIVKSAAPEPPPAVASYDPVLRAPRCSTVGSFCDSGTLLVGRGTLGPEAGQPNTINGSCADGSSGAFHFDESNDRLQVLTTDGSPLAAGRTVRVEATVFAYSDFGSDRLDLYYAANATSPAWTLIATLAPAAAGTQTLSATYTLPAGALQAVRARFRYQGSAAACGTGSYNDHDDLAFAVGAP